MELGKVTSSREVRSGVEMRPGGSSGQFRSEAVKKVSVGLAVQHQVIH